MPNAAGPVRIAVLLDPRSSVPIALLFRAIFERANRMLGVRHYQVQLVTSRPITHFGMRDVTIAVRRARGPYHYLVVTPYDDIGANWRPDPHDVERIRQHCARGGIVASACLGALTLAESGVLDGREATTHWSWSARVRARYPQVRWNTGRMVCDQGGVITAGGYLAAVDLGLHIVAATCSRELAHALGRGLLAESAREHQSIFALELTEPAGGHGALGGLDGWIERRLRSSPTAAEMARHCHMSLRSFHRRFSETYGITPRKFVQLKRIDAVRRRLAGSTRSIEQILEEVGISDPASFRRVFRRELGVSPAELRRRLRARGPARR